MKILSMFLSLCFSGVLIANSAFAQEDEIRQTGLPIKIGENSRDPNKGNLSGKVILEGLDASQPKPSVFVSVFFNGVFFDKRQVADNGSYVVPGIPRESVTVVVEINGIEAGRQQLMGSIMGSIRQDFTINMHQWQSKKNQVGVITAKDLYQRNDENEKLFRKATSATKDKKLDTAIILYKQIVANDPKDFIVWTELGTLYFGNEKYGDAEKAYNNALEQKPDFILALLNLGKLYLAQKKGEKAVSILTKAVETEPASADVQHYLGEAYLEIKKGSKAVIYLYEALRLAPIEKADIHLRLAWLYNAVGLKDKAAEEYKQFLQKVPKHSDKEKIEKYIKENSPK